MKVGRQVRGVARDAADAERRTERQRALFEHYGLPPKLRTCIRLNCRAAWPPRAFGERLVESPRLIVADEPTPGLDLDLAVRASTIFALSPMRRRRAAYRHAHRARIARGRPYRRIQRRNGHRGNRRRKLRDPSQLRHPFSRELWCALPGNGFSVPEEAIGRWPLGDARLSARRAALWFGDGWLAAFVDNAAHGEVMHRRGWYAEGNAKDARGEGHFVCV